MRRGGRHRDGRPGGMGSQSQAAPVPRAGPRRDLGATSARTRWPRPPARSGVTLREPAPPGPLRGRCASGASARAAGGDSLLISGDGLSTSSQRRDHWFEGRKGDPGGLFGGGQRRHGRRGQDRHHVIFFAGRGGGGRHLGRFYSVWVPLDATYRPPAAETPAKVSFARSEKRPCEPLAQRSAL